MMQSPRITALIGVALAAGLVLATGPLGALPALLAFVLLFAGHYPGATRLDRMIVAARRSAARSRATSRPAPRRPIRARVRRGGALIASSLAKRPPPALLSQV
jgi:hypothetical protein